jgi:hypothetical protein
MIAGSIKGHAMTDDAGLADSQIKPSTELAPPGTYVASSHKAVIEALATAVGIETLHGFYVSTYNPENNRVYTDMHNEGPLDPDAVPKTEIFMHYAGSAKTETPQEETRSTSLTSESVDSVMGNKYSTQHGAIPVLAEVATRLLVSLIDAAVNTPGLSPDVVIKKRDWPNLRQRGISMHHHGRIREDGTQFDRDIEAYMERNQDELALAQRALVITSVLQYEIGSAAKFAVDRDDMQNIKIYNFGSPDAESRFGAAMAGAGIEVEPFHDDKVSGFIVTLPSNLKDFIAAAKVVLEPEGAGKDRKDALPDYGASSRIVGDTVDQQRQRPGANVQMPWYEKGLNFGRGRCGNPKTGNDDA